MNDLDTLYPPDPFPVRLATAPAAPYITVPDPLIANILGVWAFDRSRTRLLTRCIQWAIWERRGDLLTQITVTELAAAWADLELSAFEADALSQLLETAA